MMTIKGFKEYCGETLGKLVFPVKNQLSAETKEEFFEILENVGRCSAGACGGFTGFIYYTETVDFWRKNRKKIMDYASQAAEELGENTLSMVRQFNCLKGDWTEDEIGRALYGNFDEKLFIIYNAMAWFALEEVAYRFSDYKYENEYLTD